MSTYENAHSTILLATHCVLCGRPLRDADSVERGVGPDCADKHGYGNAQGEADWDKVDALLAGGQRSQELFEVVAQHYGNTHKAANVLVHHAALAPRTARKLHVDLLAALGYHRLAVALEAAAGEVVRVTLVEGGLLAVKAPYNPAFGSAIKAARIGARWNPTDKVWEVPADQKARVGLYAALRQAYAGVLLEGPKGPVRLTKAAA